MTFSLLFVLDFVERKGLFCDEPNLRYLQRLSLVLLEVTFNFSHFGSKDLKLTVHFMSSATTKVFYL